MGTGTNLPIVIAHIAWINVPVSDPLSAGIYLWGRNERQKGHCRHFEPSLPYTTLQIPSPSLVVYARATETCLLQISACIFGAYFPTVPRRINQRSYGCLHHCRQRGGSLRRGCMLHKPIWLDHVGLDLGPDRHNSLPNSSSQSSTNDGSLI